MTEQWYSIVEYARAFNVSDMTVRRRIKTGKIHAVLKDGKYYIPVVDGKPVSIRTQMPINNINNIYENQQNQNVQNILSNTQSMLNQEPITSSTSKPLNHFTSSTLSEHQRAIGAYQQFPYTSNVVTNTIPHLPSTHQNIQKKEPSHTMSKNLTHHNTQNYYDEIEEYSLIPKDIYNNLKNKEFSLVDTNALLSYCEGSLRVFKTMEQKLEENYKSKIAQLESEIKSKELEISNLQQQVEDLQVLIKILEKKSNKT